MFISAMPGVNQTARAYEPDKVLVEEIIIGKEYHDLSQTRISISITGRNLEDAPVLIHYGVSDVEQLTNPKINSPTQLSFELTTSTGWSELRNIRRISVGNGNINISGKAEMPSVTEITPKVNISRGETLKIQGTNYNLISDVAKDEFTVEFGSSFGFSKIENEKFATNPAQISQFEGHLGLQDLMITRHFQVDNVSFDGENLTTVDFKIGYTYRNLFRLVNDLSISSDIEMFPNRGARGSKVYFKAANLTKYDVFFLTDIDGTDPYTNANKGKNPTPIQKTEDEKFIFTVEVPDIDPGEYHVVLTNPIPDNQDPMEAVSGEYAYTKEKFTVIQGAKTPVIDTISPNSGPDTGSISTITGRYLGSLNIDDLQLQQNFATPDISISGDGVMTLTYKGDDPDDIIGKYREDDVVEVEKTIKVIIGPQADVLDSSTFSRDIDKLVVRINPDTQDTNLVKDVVVETTTSISTINNNYTFTERAELPRGYTFISSRIKPEVTSIIPNEIHLARNESNGTYTYIVPEDLMVGISGRNFAVYRYTENNETKTSYPSVSFNNVELNRNTDDSIQLQVLNNQGNIVDGTTGNEIGTKIRLIIPKDTPIPSEYIDTSVQVVITNPVRNSPDLGLSSEEPVMVRFLVVKEDKAPVIESITPDVVTVQGGEDVVIKGSNFLQDVKVFIDGTEVSNIKREGDGKTITFKAPPGREGVTQLQVMNPDGGIAIRDFYYVQTYTDPKIIDFSPKSGNTGTLVLVKGDNFLRPDPTATANEIYKLIGTRILLENRDINEYNTHPVTRRPILEYYRSPENDEILSIKDAVDGSKYIHMADYWHSVIFSDESGKYYTLTKDARGNPILSDGVNNIYRIKLKAEEQDQQIIYKMYAEKEGAGEYLVKAELATKTIGGVEKTFTELIISETPQMRLSMQTPYRIDNIGIIVGNNVKVIDKNQILFTVPILTFGDGWYDVTVLNPDTKRDSRIDQQGFFYYTLPPSKPEIHEITPDKGSVDGGYYIDIKGTDFKDDGTYKSRVFINGIEIPSSDVFVSVDGKSLTVKVPPYTGDLTEKSETDRFTVPVVVLNPDGASAGKEDGFTYMVPTSHPEITRIIPQQGSAAGKEIVEITGKDFRFFEPFSDDNRNQIRDENEVYNDLNGNNEWDDFRNKTIEELRVEYGDDFERIVLQVLPKVYFGNEVAEIIEIDDGYLKVKTPAGIAGDVDVYVVNNDSGISNKVKYTYMSTNPVITRIVPPEGRKQGGDRVEIFGSNFVESEIKILNGYGNFETLPMAQVRFGNVTNRDIPREEENSGRIDNQRTTVNLSGGLRVEYANGQVVLRISESGSEYVTVNPIDFDGSPLFISTKLLKARGTDSYPYAELIRLEIQDRRLFIERGYAPEVEFLNRGQLVVTTPGYYSIGEVDVTVINPDKGIATGRFTYKNPASNPYIVNMTKEGQSPIEENINGRDVKVLTMTYKGGNTLSIIGGDFRENARIQISDVATILPNNITYMLPSRLTFTMPQVPEEAVGKLHRVVVINEDGGTASSDEVTPLPIYIMFIKGETAPSITSLIPDKGPASGGTSVKIEGADFREGLKVFFGEIPVAESNIQVVDYKTILVITPPHSPGSVEVKVENPDGELSNPNGIFTYLSSPNISAVVNPNDPTETERISRISVEGGETIKIKGSSFMQGARIVFAPVIKRIDNEEQVAGTIIYIDGLPYLLESGVDGGQASFIDAETLTIITPPGRLDSRGIIVINPDGGASDIYDHLVYGLPEITAPINVEAELVYDQFIRISWSQVERAQGYEIYVVIDDKQMDFIGSTEFTRFAYTNIEPNTRYRFVVTALGPFGSSKPSAESNTVRTGKRVGPPDEDGKLVEETIIQKTGDIAQVIIGTNNYREDTTIDLTNTNFYRVSKTVITIPAEVVVRSNVGNIAIIGPDYTLKFNPRIFETNRVRQYQNRRDAGIRFEVFPYANSSALGNKSLLSGQYMLKAEFYLGQEASSIDYFDGHMELILEYDKTKADLRKLSEVALYRYDDYNSSWQEILKGHDQSITLKAFINRTGRYAILGARR